MPCRCPALLLITSILYWWLPGISNIASGMSATSFIPNSICNCTRIVNFLYRAFARLNQSDSEEVSYVLVSNGVSHNIYRIDRFAISKSERICYNIEN